LFEVTDLTTHGCSFFGDSNCPTLFICYQGSIEKLTLLGAIYYYYYYSKQAEYQQVVITPKFNTKCAIKLQEFEWSLV
jgi:hypothetical protein